MAHWAKSPLDRRQQVLFAPTLDQTVSADHPVRLLAETLDRLDFSEWESMYVRVVGQPPIHPRVLAGCLIYGLSLGIRSRRRLEDAAGNRLDFIWLLNGCVPDHATLCKFRISFGPQIKSLFRQVGRVAMAMGLIALNQGMLDGTDVKSNNSRHSTHRHASLQRKQEALDRQIETLLAETEAQDQDQADDAWLGEATPTKLPKPLRDLTQRQERLGRAMEALKELEKTPRPGKNQGPSIPTTDPDSRVLSCKQGGYAPGYTVVAATDAEHGLIVDVDVIAGNDEAGTVLPAVERIENFFDRKPSEMVADSGFNTGANLAELAERGIEPLMPARQSLDASSVQREDPTRPVAESERAKLPMSPQNKKLDRSAFLYDRRNDRYHCPMGRPLPLTEHRTYNRPGQKGIYNVYESLDCGGCPLASQCLIGRSPRRRLCRDEYEELREAMARRINSEEGRRYKRRAPVAERPFAVFKSLMNFRQFLVRGMKKVKIELDWVATTFNVMALIRATAP